MSGQITALIVLCYLIPWHNDVMTFSSSLLQADNMQFAAHCVIPFHTSSSAYWFRWRFFWGLVIHSFIHSEVSASCIAASMWFLAITTFRLQRSLCTMAVQLWYSVFSCSDFGFVLQRDWMSYFISDDSWSYWKWCTNRKQDTLLSLSQYRRLTQTVIALSLSHSPI